MTDRFQRILPALLVLACLLPFVPGLSGPFLHDDAINIGTLKVGPFSVQSAIDVAFRNESGLLRRPLSNLSLAANLWLHGELPFGFKLFNLALHGACGLALLAFLRALLEGLKPGWAAQRSNSVALLATLLWMVHPLQVSTALYVVQRMAQWPALFLFLLAWRFQCWLNRGDFSQGANQRMLATWLLLLALALASKENGALAPLLMGVQWLIFRARGDAPSISRWPVLAMIGLPLLAGAYIAASHPDFILGGYASREFNPQQRIMTEAVVLWHYLRLWFVPWVPWMGLYSDTPIFGTTSPLALMALTVWLAVASAALLLRRRFPVVAFAVLWFLAAHAMESTLLPLELVYEHRNYLAMPGMALLVAAALECISRKLEVRLPLLVAPVLLVLAGATLHRAHTWSSPDMFALSEYQHHPASNRAAMLMLSRSQAVGDNTRFDLLLSEIKSRNPGTLWALTLDAALQCSRANASVDWNAILQSIRQHGTDNRSIQILRQTSINIMNDACPHIERARFVETLELGYRRALAEGNLLQVELFGSYLGWIAKKSGDENLAARWFLRTAQSAPQSVEPLFDLAYAHLNAGRLPEAAAAIAELRRRERAQVLHIGYRIDELDGFMAQEDAVQGR